MCGMVFPCQKKERHRTIHRTVDGALCCAVVGALDSGQAKVSLVSAKASVKVPLAHFDLSAVT
jgi:hypothetical protein